MALFPRLADCSHFHYENNDVHQFTIVLKDIEAGAILLLMVNTKDNGWHVRRTWPQLVAMDKRFHDCIISRATTGLHSLQDKFGDRRSVCSVSCVDEELCEEHRTVPRVSQSCLLEGDTWMVEDHKMELMAYLKEYFNTFSSYTNTNINCAPILNFFEMDNHGYRLTVPDEDVVNKPAVAAAQVVRRHVAQDSDEITLEVGDFVSIVDMPADAPWWRAKQGMRVGLFPAECVTVIGRGQQPGPASEPAENGSDPAICDPSGYKAVALTRGKTISRLILALFGKSRPTPYQLRRKGILRDRVFGCDLGVYLSTSRREVPLPLMVCAQIIEDNGVIDGIYRRSGAQTHVQELRRSFDEDRRPIIDPDLLSSDIHCFSSLLKTYFGELPTALFSHTIYRMLRQTLALHGEEARLNATFRVLSRLPPPYFRTARYLFVHLYKMANQHSVTLMNAKNLAICWAPNLMKPSGELDYNRPDPALMAEVRDNPRLVEYIITYAPQLFSDRPPNWQEVLAAKVNRQLSVRPTCTIVNGLDVEPPGLISLAEARRKFGCRSVINMSSEEGSGASELITKQRAHSMVVGPTRRDARDYDEVAQLDHEVDDYPVCDLSDDVLEEVWETDTPLLSGGGNLEVPSSPVLPSEDPGRSRLPQVHPALQQKQQLIQRQLKRQQKQRLSDYPLLSGSCTPSDFRNRSHSLVEHSSSGNDGGDLMNEIRQEQASPPRARHHSSMTPRARSASPYWWRRSLYSSLYKRRTASLSKKSVGTG